MKMKILLLILPILQMSACIIEEDPCANTVCLNGGDCLEGSCFCPSGYEGFNCETKTITTPPEPDCVVNSTSKVQFENRSGTNTTYDVIWDGSRIKTLSPGEMSIYYTVAAGSHTMHFKISNSNLSACNPSTPVLVQCGSPSYYCTY